MSNGWTPELVAALRTDLHAQHRLTRELLDAVRELRDVIAITTSTLTQIRDELATIRQAAQAA